MVSLFSTLKLVFALLCTMKAHRTDSSRKKHKLFQTLELDRSSFAHSNPFLLKCIYESVCEKTAKKTHYCSCYSMYFLCKYTLPSLRILERGLPFASFCCKLKLTLWKNYEAMPKWEKRNHRQLCAVVVELVEALQAIGKMTVLVLHPAK